MEKTGILSFTVWLLMEPLIHGAQLDVQDTSRPALTQRLCSAGSVKLKRIVDTVCKICKA